MASATQGLEVHIKNVPEQASENGLKKFLRPVLAKLSISIRHVHCQKHRGKRFAQMTFLHATDGERFLAHHGQIQATPGQENIPPSQNKSVHNRGNSVSNRHALSISSKSFTNRPRPASSFAVNLFFLSQPIYCYKSNQEANPYLLRVLEKEEKDRQTRATTVSAVAHDSRAHVTETLPFNATSVSCGVWTYFKSNLVYAPQVKLNYKGVAKFGERAMVLKLDSGHRIEFRYEATWGILMETGDIPSFIFSMMQPPHLFEEIQGDPVADLLAQLNIQSGGMRMRKNGPKRYRVPYLTDDHAPIAGNCMVYRITLSLGDNDGIGERMQRLRKATGIPPTVHIRTDLYTMPESYADGLKILYSTLSSMSIGLPFNLLFQIQKLAQNSYLLPRVVLGLLPEIRAMTARSSLPVCISAVRKLFSQINYPSHDSEATEFQVDGVIELLKENEQSFKTNALLLEYPGFQGRSENVAVIHRAKVSPTGVFLYGPEPESNNRILRKYPDHHEYFLRVQFCDEDGQPIRYGGRASNDRILNGRFTQVLKNGINIAGRIYAFLGFSNSSLRAQSCWFMAPFVYKDSLIYDHMLIADLGDFSVIRCPAKCAARIGQTFSDTPNSVAINPAIVFEIPDVKVKSTDEVTRVFSDGVGTMSKSVMYKIWDRLSRAGAKPTVFQIRYSGAKGMISLDSRLQGDALVLRPSMIKFEGSNKTDIELCDGAWKPLPVYLNRQFIKILEDLGTEERFFLDLQAREVNRLRSTTQNPFNASLFLQRHLIGENTHLPWLINKLTSLNLNYQLDGFLRNVLEMAVLIELRLLKHKTRIPVPKGWHLHGIMDETGYLKEGQIYCVVLVEGVPRAITGKNLIITRAPALHPGDVQLVEGVWPPADSPLMDLYNCIVFSQNGSRDLPSQLSGGDLDGDRYYLIWDKNALPKQLFEPSEYARVPPIDIGRQVDQNDMIEFFIQFMESDQLGQIATKHQILADQMEDGTLNPDCIKLAEMHSTAVDFAKTGIPVDMSQLPKYNNWRPDFLAPGPHVTIEKKDGLSFEETHYRDLDDEEDDEDSLPRFRYYESTKILGKLYRSIDEREIFSQIQQRSSESSKDHASTVIHAVWDYIQQVCRLIQWEHLEEWARGIRDMYEECLLNTMSEYSEHPRRPLTELEAFVGNILGKTGAQTKHQHDISTTLKEKFDNDAAYFVNCIVKEGAEYSGEALERSMACLNVSLEERLSKGKEEVLSFKYLAAAVCLREVERFQILI